VSTPAQVTAGTLMTLEGISTMHIIITRKTQLAALGLATALFAATVALPLRAANAPDEVID
jgi:hypothetical protein